MFMSFLENLYYQTEIGQAFDIVCIKKMLTDGYVDMSAFIYARIKKEDMLEKLTADQSRFAVLYKDCLLYTSFALKLKKGYILDQRQLTDTSKIQITRAIS